MDLTVLFCTPIFCQLPVLSLSFVLVFPVLGPPGFLSLLTLLRQGELGLGSLSQQMVLCLQPRELPLPILFPSLILSFPILHLSRVLDDPIFLDDPGLQVAD